MSLSTHRRITLCALVALLVVGCTHDWESTWIPLPDAAVDAAVDDAPRPDALFDAAQDQGDPVDLGASELPHGDLGPQPPVKLETKPFSDKATCTGANEVAVGGGGTCTTGVLSKSLSPSSAPKSWVVACTTGNVASAAYAICLDKDKLPGSSTVLYSFTAPAGTAETSKSMCTSPKVPAGGGCDCRSTGLKLLRSSLESGTLNWLCKCNSGAAIKTTGVCMAQPSGYENNFVDSTTPGTIVASCSKPSRVVLSGGCDGEVTSMVPQKNSFTCSFVNKGTAWVICAY